MKNSQLTKNENGSIHDRFACCIYLRATSIYFVGGQHYYIRGGIYLRVAFIPRWHLFIGGDFLFINR